MNLEIRYIEWTDSAGRAHWHDISAAKKLTPDSCKTIGFVLNETDDYIVVIQSHTNREDEAENQADNALCIPKSAVSYMTALFVGRSEAELDG
mgnify:CR=1 FL=1